MKTYKTLRETVFKMIVKKNNHQNIRLKKTPWNNDTIIMHSPEYSKELEFNWDYSKKNWILQE